MPPLSTVVSEGSAAHPKKAPKSVAGSSVHSSSHSLPSRVSSFSRSGGTTASQKVSKLSQAAAFTELKHLMAGLLDMLHITPEDSAAKSCHKMMLFINKDNYLHPAQKMHCVLLFIDNVGYTDCLRGLVGEITDPNDPNIVPEQLASIREYYTTLLNIVI